MEASVVPPAGFPTHLLPGRGLQRRLTWTNVSVILQTGRAFVQAWRLVGRLKPRVVVGVGGYAALPCTVVARLRRIPVVVHEQNAAPGLANRIAVKLGAQAAIALPGTPLPEATVTGNPIRASVAAVHRGPSGPRPLVAVFGGSLGARRVNQAATGLYDLWRGRADVAVHHVTGAAGHEETTAALAGLRRDGDRIGWDLVRYEDDMPGLYARAALAVCRAGATSVAELAAAGMPSVLVPLPGAPGDHQTRNAMALVDGGAAVLVPDAECTGERLAAEVGALLADPDRLEGMSRAARAMARPDAADRLADLVEAAAGNHLSAATGKTPAP
jgi:UDP-N-acetylglucosamine--N-acetylmuramyl-(pentapeptide) pyrophosphoryl-undecaprenol N-acetylglucosamine transferase